MAFQYKSLDGWLMPGIAYFRKLQEHAMQMEQEIAKLKEQLAVSGSRALQDRAEEWSKQWQDINIETGKLKRQLIELESQKDAEIARLQYQVEYLEQQLSIYQQAENPQKKKPARDEQTGRFTSSVPDRDKPFRAWMMDQQGYGTAQIAAKLGVSADTVKRYVRSEKAMRTEDGELRPGVYVAQ